MLEEETAQCNLTNKMFEKKDTIISRAKVKKTKLVDVTLLFKATSCNEVPDPSYIQNKDNLFTKQTYLSLD